MVEFGRSRAGTRLRDLITPQLVEGEQLEAWTRAWISRDGRYNWLVGSRHRDFDERFERIVVEDTGRTPQRRLQVTGFQRKPLRFDLGPGPDSAEVATALLAPREDDPCPS